MKKDTAMMISAAKECGQRIVAIEGALTIHTAAAHYATLMEALGSGENLVLKLDNVEECDAAGVQLVLSAIETFDAENRSLAVEGVAPAVLEAFSACGARPVQYPLPDRNG